MAVRTKKSNETKQAVEKKQPAKKVTRRQALAENHEADRRQKAVESFHPSVVEFLNKQLGVDLQKLPLEQVYDLAQGKLTREPVSVVVTPLAFDRSKKKNVEMPAIKALVSLRVLPPMENGKPVAIDKNHSVFVQTVPCRPFISKDGAADMGMTAASESADAAEERQNPTFTDAQLLALEGIGVSRERMFGGFNHIDKLTKLDMLDGNTFFVDGAVKTSFGLVNVIGEGRLSTDAKGVAKAEFEPQYPEKRAEGLVIDLLGARVIGNLELDFFRRTSDGKVITSVDGRPIINEAARNIVNYGVAMEPVRGWVRRRVFDDKENKYVEKREPGMYVVTAVNGNLFATKMKEIKEQAPDGTDISRYEVPNLRMRDGKVFVDGKSEALEFVSERDARDYVAGKGGLVKDAVYLDRQKNKEQKYEAFVVPDNTRGGYARQFTPETTKKILARREGERKTTRKRQNFSMGI